MKKYQAFRKGLRILIFGESAEQFEDKLVLSATLYVSLFLFVSFAFNLISGLKTSIVITSFVGFFVFLILYFVTRFISKNKFMIFLLAFVMLLFMDLVWMVNYGSHGPVMQFFIVLFSFLVLLFQRKYYALIAATIILNIIGLYLIESYYPDFTGQYPTPQTQLNDNFLGLIISILIILSFLSAIKNNYIQEYKRAKMSDHLKSAFVANLSHEIRTPLNAIVGFSSLMTDPDIHDNEKKVFEKHIQHNSDYLLSLIEDIIDVSRIESNQLSVKLQDVNVVPLVRQIIQSFQLTVPHDKNLMLTCNFEGDELVVRVDRIRLEQILRNLLSNAIKFTDTGIIEVGCRKVKENYTFSVKDSGIGIHIEHQQAIFERFRKIDNSKQHLYRGTGIGLFLSRHLVEMFGGKIWVESDPGKGSTFYFTIPA